jgi:murein DD-endopeptidase MepM/ murein hydrolase activator NlpD
MTPDDDTLEVDGRFLLVEEGFLMKASPLTEQGARSLYTQGTFHTVEQGDTVATIAKLYGLKPETIRFANDLKDGQAIKPGQKLLILPVDGVMHAVKRGENLLLIAERYGIDPDVIRQQNDLEGSRLIAGQQLIIPGGKPVTAKPPTQVATAQPTSSKGTNPAVTKKLPEQPLSIRRQIYEDTSGALGTLQKPCDCYITQYFSSRHFALDMQKKDGKGGFGGPVFAADDGEVIRADTGWNGGYGNVIEIAHKNGLVTLYGHNKLLLMKVGDKVKRGEQIADMGRTGLVYGPTGIHVHFEVRVNGVKKNPLLYIGGSAPAAPTK